MSPRLEAVGRYHRAYRRHMEESRRLALAECHVASDRRVVLATTCYFAAQNEAHPEKARDRA